MATAVAPHNLDAEESVLGACLISDQALERSGEMLDPSHFYREGHGTIFGAMLAMKKRGDPVDALLLAGELSRLGVLEKVGGQSRLQQLLALMPTASNVGHYAALVLEAAQQRTLYSAALAIQNAASNGGITAHPELLDEMQFAIDEARILPGEPVTPPGPVFMSVYEFVEQRFTNPDPLLGIQERSVLARGSLSILAGRPGTGKTTLVMDLACHLAAGLPWPPPFDPESERCPVPWDCPAPLNVAIIVNEGPQEMFRAKLEDKLKAFPHSIRDAGGKLMVQSWRWGAFSFADRDAYHRAAEALHENDIDLVIGDPLLSMGTEGVGSPRETTDFVQLLVPLGLKSNRAFLFLHHFRERAESTEDELGRLSGAWGGHLDTLMTLAATQKKDELRLAYPKLRWWRGAPEPDPIIVGKVYAAQSFEALAQEGDATLLEPNVAAFLAERRSSEADGGEKAWATADEIRKGIKARGADVRKALEGGQHLFISATGVDAKTLGRAPKAILWGLREWADDLEAGADGLAQESLDVPADDGIPF